MFTSTTVAAGLDPAAAVMMLRSVGALLMLVCGVALVAMPRRRSRGRSLRATRPAPRRGDAPAPVRRGCPHATKHPVLVKLADGSLAKIAWICAECDEQIVASSWIVDGRGAPERRPGQ